MRLNVGAVIVQDRSIVSVGYNGVPAGEPHCAGNDCPGKHHCQLTTHAEMNAIKHLPRNVAWGDLDLYVTDSPCEHCYENILQFGAIGRIFFSTPYRLDAHLKAYPRSEGYLVPEVYRVLPAGYVMDWRTKELVEVST